MNIYNHHLICNLILSITMTYIAPRQGLFAIIILISFILHSVLMVFSLEQQLDANREHKAEQLITELTKTTAVAFYKDDRVSLSVIADRYSNEIDVTRLVLINNKGNVLVQTGNAPLQTGTTYQKPVLLENSKVGDIELTIKRTSKGEMVKTLWPFELGALIVHLLIWLLYGYLARPTKNQLQQLSRDIHDYYVLHYDMADNKKRPAHLDDEERDNIEQDNKNDTTHKNDKNTSTSIQNHTTSDANADDHTPQNIEQIDTKGNANAPTPSQVGNIYNNISLQVSRFLKRDKTNKTTSPQSVHDNRNNSLDDKNDNDKNHDNKSHDHKNHNTTDKQQTTLLTSVRKSDHATNDDNHLNAQKIKQNTDVKPSTSNQNRQIHAHADTPIVVAFMFADEHQLLNKLSSQVAEPYLTLCNDLLHTASTKLLQQSSFQGVELQKIEPFDIDSPARITIRAKHGFDNANSKLAKAGVMLAMLCMMVNKIIFDKHRELKRFALPINAAVAHTEQSEPMLQLVGKRAQEHQTYVLLTAKEINQINQHIQLTRLVNPKSVYERECLRLIGADENTISHLAKLRNDLLTL